MAFTGTPIYNAYLRLMGARIGRNVVISSRHGPVCADMLTIGDNTILRKDTIVLGYRAQSNFIHIGPVEIGGTSVVIAVSAAHREDAVQAADALLEVTALDRGHGGEQQVADGVTRQAVAFGGPGEKALGGREPVLEQLAHQRLRVGEGSDAVADVADGRDAQLLAQDAG